MTPRQHFYMCLKHCLGGKVILIYLTALFFATTLLPAEGGTLSIDLVSIANIESSNNPNAYNKRTQARGLYQITPICLADYNNFHRNKRISNDDLFKPLMARNVAEWYINERIPGMLKYYGIKDTIETRLRCYNSGIGNLRKGRLTIDTRKYIEKYRRLTKGV
jgi:soluble lytic murein transglycosylase-like protein